MPFAADAQNGEIAGAERRAFDGKATLFVLCEPTRFHAAILSCPSGQMAFHDSYVNRGIAAKRFFDRTGPEIFPLLELRDRQAP
jgi:hypothetical protein